MYQISFVEINRAPI